jgi:hypothetical protein
MEPDPDFLHMGLAFFKRNIHEKLHIVHRDMPCVTERLGIDPGAGRQGRQKKRKGLGCGFIPPVFHGLIGFNLKIFKNDIHFFVAGEIHFKTAHGFSPVFI